MERVFAEAGLYSRFTAIGPPPGMGVRVMTGLEFDLAHVGLAVAPSLGSGAGGMPVAQGFAGKLRLSAERYTSLAERTGEALRITLGGYAGDRGMYRLIEQLERLGEQRGPVVLIELEDLRFGWAQTEELR